MSEQATHKPRIWVISADSQSYASLWRNLADRLDVTNVCLSEPPDGNGLPVFGRKRTQLRLLGHFVHPRKLRSALAPGRTVVITGHIVLPFLLYNMLRLRNHIPAQIYVFALFFHSRKLMRLYGFLLRPLLHDEVRFIVFSKADIAMYEQCFRLSSAQLVYVPYGKGPVQGVTASSGSYCFAGGYSNRDYDTLIAAFRQLDCDLVICCSHSNRLPNVLPPNIVVYRERPRHEFAELVAGARLCILPLYDGTGASGQSVTLQYMQFGKAIVATRVTATEDYLDETNAVFVPPADVDALADAVRTLWTNPELGQQLGDKARQDYFAHFQSAHFESQLVALLMKTAVV